MSVQIEIAVCCSEGVQGVRPVMFHQATYPFFSFSYDGGPDSVCVRVCKGCIRP